MICSTWYKAIAEQYADDVLSGNIVASKSVVACCKRHLSDLTRQYSDNFPYYFDEQEANAVCEFFPLALKHSKGKFAGHQFELSPYQVFIRWVLFGWKRCSDNTRRFRKCHMSVARKNGKSTDAAGLGLYGLMADGEAGAEIYVAAVTMDQAGCVFTEAERMRESSPNLRDATKNHVKKILCPSTNGFFKPISSERKQDGLNPHFVIFDELHAWTKTQLGFYETMTTAAAARTQPLELIITTAGDDNSQIWLDEYRMCKSVVLNEIIDESRFVFIAELDEDDDPFNEDAWIKANPNLGVSVDLEYLRLQAHEAKHKKSFYPAFLSKHCNRITASSQSAFDLSQWDSCRKSKLSDWGDADCIGAGFDMGGYDDLASYALCARFSIGEEKNDSGETVSLYRYECRTYSYIHQDCERDLKQLPFAEWIYAGHLKACMHPSLELTRDMLSDCYEFSVNQVAFDRYNARHASEQLESEGIQPVQMPQTYAHFNEPIRQLLEAIRTGRFAHDGNPVLRWCVKNAVVIKNNKGDWMFNKGRAADKIDAVVALTMAFRVASLAPSRPTGSLYLS